MKLRQDSGLNSWHRHVLRLKCFTRWGFPCRHFRIPLYSHHPAKMPRISPEKIFTIQRWEWVPPCPDCWKPPISLLVGGLVAMNFIFPEILGMSSFQLTNKNIFQRGGEKPPTRLWITMSHHKSSLLQPSLNLHGSSINGHFLEGGSLYKSSIFNPLVNVHITLENHIFSWVNQLMWWSIYVHFNHSFFYVRR